MPNESSEGPTLQPAGPATVTFACAADPRFSFSLYVPRGYAVDCGEPWPLCVVVHGSLRNAAGFRDGFAAFADAERVVLLAPLFPAEVDGRSDDHNYKFLAYRDIRFDRLLLSMIAQAAALYRLQSERVLLFGFSGGGQFVHRFFYLHPDRLLAVSIGAPGLVTLLGNQPWWVGTGNLAAVLGTGPDIAAMRGVPVQMIAGDGDTATDEITVEPESRLYQPGANDAGTTRIERLRTLAAKFTQAGIGVRFDLVPGVAHDGLRPELLQRVQQFFADTLAETRARALP